MENEGLSYEMGDNRSCSPKRVDEMSVFRPTDFG